MSTPSTTFTILLAGPVTITQRLRTQTHGTRVIAADGGIHHAQALALIPELWVGDFDSAVPEDGRDFPAMKRQAYPTDKNATDGALAIEEALNRGATRLILVGAFGGRTDHTFALLAHACALAKSGLDVLLSSGVEEGTPLSPVPQAFDYADGTQFSVLAFTNLEELTLAGARWPLEAITMAFGDTLTISNKVAGTLRADVQKGTALLVAALQER